MKCLLYLLMLSTFVWWYVCTYPVLISRIFLTWHILISNSLDVRTICILSAITNNKVQNTYWIWFSWTFCITLFSYWYLTYIDFLNIKIIIYMSLCKFHKQIQPVQTNPFKLCKIKRKSLSVATQSRFHIF